MPQSIQHSLVVPQFTILSASKKHHEVTEAALARIKSGQNGRNLLSAICQILNHNPDKRLYIDCANHEQGSFVQGRLTDSQVRRFRVSDNPDDPKHEQAMLHLRAPKPDNTPGEGVNPIVRFHPDEAVWTDAMNIGHSVLDPRISFITLAHELVHAFHLLNGTSLATLRDHIWIDGSGQRLEENRAVGSEEFAGNPFSENGVRADHGIPLRASYLLAEHIAPLH
ncbi:hypothetical protein F3J37_01595 [Pantoea sp. Al-1710]|uniref:T3SS effector protein NleD n=1 Tax=Candidatus Pantoea communis TaxID=2608354 RepID=A0ABX0RKQ1_9GAMM|nr:MULTISPECIES: M91 family zinc metallopeptidase [Pantoea]NIG12927.1 hypothetical protein [Pantoea sp. Cy-640]NIG17372.1 hypothetical protein [Pantoea communis]